MDSYDVTFGPTDALNSGCGYQIEIKQDGKLVLFTGNNPATGAPLDYAGCLRVAGMYGPARSAATELTAEEYRNEVAGAKQVECSRPGGGVPSECHGYCSRCEWGRQE
jgi:hypothetical protein